MQHGDAATGTEGGGSPARSRAFASAHRAALVVAGPVLVTSTYWFFANDHRVDLALMFGLPQPSGASHREGFWSSAAWLFTAFGSIEVVFVLAFSLMSFLLLAGRLKDAATTILSVAGGAAAGYAAKALTGHFRPHHVHGTTDLLNTSFPSGHALLATLLFGTAAMLVARSTRSTFTAAAVWTAAAAMMLGVGLSRVYLGTHWPSDVLAGWAAGVLWLTAADRLVRGARED